MQTNPPSAHLEQQAREAARLLPGYPDAIRGETAIRAMIAFRDAPKPAPEHHELREKVLRSLQLFALDIRLLDAPVAESTIASTADAILALISNPSPDTSELVDGTNYV